KQHAGIDIWLTGMPVLEWDESQSSQRDMQNATLLSLVGVAVIIVFGFGSWRMPCVAVLCLSMGLMWTVGLATIFIGHLNLFSVAFGAIIAGLGIDYAIHLLSRLSSQSHSVQDDEAHLPEALRDAVGHCGKGILTGSVTTAAAFGVAMLTPFRGMTELGTICALGTLSCMVATIWILPALLVWQSRLSLPVITRRSPTEDSPAKVTSADCRIRSMLLRFRSLTNSGIGVVNGIVLRQRFSVVVGICAITVLAGMQAGRLRYDHNLLNLQAAGLPSVHAELELTRRSGQSAWFAISMAHSPQQARALHEQLSKLPSVDRVEEIGSVIASATTHPYKSELVAACREHAAQLVQQLAMVPTQAMAAVDPSASSLVRTAIHTTTSHTELVPAIGQVVMPMQQLAESVEQMAAGASPTLEDFPDSVRDRMASHDGETFLLRIFAKENLWQRENLGKFVKELESVDPRVTGHPIQTWYASGELENSYYQAGIYALLAVAALLMIDFGSIRLVMLAMVPVCLSMLQLCGLLVWMEIPFNAANMIVLPLIIGIGIDDGVHIMHEYATRGSKTFTLSTDTTLAILLTSLTTIVGFGSMGIADHRGLQSLGIVLLVGVGLCLLNSWFTLPAVLSYFGPQDTDLEPQAAAAPKPEPASRKAPVVQPIAANAGGNASGPSLLLRDVPIVMSLPDYPDLRC
ncbi:MAG: MMPL family transporter, partial [Aureliella sp.]